MNVYPNPATSEINIEVINEKQYLANEEYVVSVNNSFGQEITQRVIPSGARNLKIDTSQFPKGLCLVEVCTAERKVCHTQKVLIQ